MLQYMENSENKQQSQLSLPSLSSRKSSSSTLCDVCFEPYHILGRWPMLACPNQHFFCDQCIEGMFKYSENEPVPCPVCRALIRQSKVKPHYQLFKAINKEHHLRQTPQAESNELFLYAFQHEIFEVAAAFKSAKPERIAQITKLDCTKRRITKAEHMKAFPALVYLKLDRNSLTNCDGLSVLANLRYLTLNHNSIRDIKALCQLKKLTHLSLEGNCIAVIDSLMPFANLMHWFLLGNPLEGIIADELLLVEFCNLLSLSLSCRQPQKITDVFLPGLAICESLPKLSRVITDDPFSEKTRREVHSRLEGRTQVRWIKDKQTQAAHQAWVEELMDESQQYGEIFNFRIDPSSPYFSQYSAKADRIEKISSNFVIVNSSHQIRKFGKVNFRIRVDQPSDHMLMGLCNGYLKHNANIYSEHFVGLAFWGFLYARGETYNLTAKLRLNEKPVVRMSVDFEAGFIRWFSADNEVGAVPFPQQFRHSSLYFLLGMRDAGTAVTVLRD